MTNKRVLFKFISVLIFCSVFLIEERIFGVPVVAVLTFYCGIYLVSSQYKRRLHRAGNFNGIKRMLLILLIYSVLTYIWNYRNNDLVISNYFANTGEYPSNLYIKMCLNGFLVILLSYYSFLIGSLINGDASLLQNILRLIVNFAFILALVNVCTWLVSTGGIVGRYNFTPILISSYGINILWSILGFLLLLADLDKFKVISLNSLKLLVFLLSIIIIMSRLNQLVFVVSVLLYYLQRLGGISKFKVIGLFIFVTIVPYIFLRRLSSQALSSYTALLSFKNEDYLIRLSTISNSLKIFYDNLLTGVGYGMFNGYNTSHIIVQRTKVNLGSPHNGLISILAETGLIGLLVNIGLLRHVLRGVISSVKRYAHKYDFTVAIKVFIVVNIILLLVSNYFLLPPPSEYNYVGISIVSWLLIGGILSLNSTSSFQ